MDTGNNRHASRWRLARWGTVAALLLLPAVAMLFTDEIAWGAEDFAAAGALLIGAAALYELARRRTRSAAQRGMVAAALVSLVLVIWAHAAVGVF